MPSSTHAPSLPASATHQAVGLSGFISFICAYLYCLGYHPFSSMAHYALFMIAATGLGLVLPEIFFQKRFCSKDSGFLPKKMPLNLKRVFIKCFGLYGIIALFAFAFFVFPEYNKTSFYAYFYDIFPFLFFPWVLLSPFYIAFVDRRLEQPKDDLWHLGLLLSFQWKAVDFQAARREFLRWGIKAFFTPLMLIYMSEYLATFLNPKALAFDFSLLQMPILFAASFAFLYFIDTTFAALSYLMCFKPLDSHIRSPEPSFFGWAVAIACYPPFKDFMPEHYWSYKTDYTWSSWLYPQDLSFYLWGGAIFVCLALYTWATLSFGIRFSNLTHRGIITNGPYRFTKHPHYIFKNLAWWLINIPFFGRETFGQAVAHCAGLLTLNYIYYLRAKTEERHLMQDPVYQDYAKWIDAHGLFRFVNKIPLVGRLAQLKLSKFST